MTEKPKRELPIANSDCAEARKNAVIQAAFENATVVKQGCPLKRKLSFIQIRMRQEGCEGCA